MNKFKFYFIVIIASVSLFSCNNDDDTTTAPPRDFKVQYETEAIFIKDYLNSHYLAMDLTNPNFADNDVVIKKIDNGQAPIMSYLNSDTYPKLLVRNVIMHNVTTGYNIYYLVLRPGVGESPTNVDGVLAAYKGTYLTRSAATATPALVFTSTLFEEVKFPQSTLSLYGVIKGRSEIFPQFKTGKSEINEDGTVTHTDFGAGVMFIPSGLGYYNSGSSSIPAYAPLVFSFKLYAIERLDQDNDGIISYHEQNDLIKDGYIYNYLNTTQFPTTPANDIRYADDFPDNDGIPNFFDVDDDGDNYTTKLEITKPTGKVGVVIENGVPVNYGPSAYYPYDAFTIADNPLTTVDESLNSEPRGIPAYSATGTPDYTTPNRLRIHLDKDHHTAQP